LALFISLLILFLFLHLIKFLLFSSLGCLPLCLDSLSLLLHFVDHVAVPFLFIVGAVGAATSFAIDQALGFVSFIARGDATLRPYSNILLNEVISEEVSHLLHLVVFYFFFGNGVLSLFNDFLKLSADNTRDILKGLRH